MKYIVCILVILFALQSCEFAEVENPNVTVDKFVETPQATSSWLNGIRRQAALTMNEFVVLSELVSDNYYNNRTLSSKVFDFLQIDFIDVDVLRLQNEVHRLRGMTEFGLSDVVPNDPNSTAAQEAEIHFFKGLAHLLSGEYFVGLPAEDLGPVLEPEAHFQLALTEFNEAFEETTDDNLSAASRLARARIFYHQGDQANAVAEVDALIANSPDFLYQLSYDGVNGVPHDMQFFLYDSENDEFAPLPRLDFLDPKYFSTGDPALDQKPMNLFKGEEAFFIKAEAQLANNDLAGAKNTLVTLLEDVIQQRPTALVDDSRETRSGGNRNDYPLSDTVQVAFSPGAAPQPGLVLDRQAGDITVYPVSGTQVTTDDINNAASADELLELLYLMRQEVFLAEGRRIVDLGVKYPVAENEFRNNPNIGEAALEAQIPDFLPRDGSNALIDDFSVDTEKGIVTITYDLNRLLVENKNSPLVLPFH